VVGALVVFGLGALAVGLVVRGNPDDVALKLALPLLVLGLGSGAIITPNHEERRYRAVPRRSPASLTSNGVAREHVLGRCGERGYV
jgi:hypothetical protein